jgi:hypothetical protein
VLTARVVTQLQYKPMDYLLRLLGILDDRPTVVIFDDFDARRI